MVFFKLDTGKIINLESVRFIEVSATDGMIYFEVGGSPLPISLDDLDRIGALAYNASLELKDLRDTIRDIARRGTDIPEGVNTRKEIRDWVVYGRLPAS